MPNKFLFIVCHIIGMVATSAQGNFEIEWNESVVFIDQVGASSNSFLGMNGYGLKSDLIIWKSFPVGSEINFRFGSGVSNLWYMYANTRPRAFSTYIPIKLGLDFPILSENLELYGQIANYILVNRKSEKVSFNYPANAAAIIEKRVYSNVELGLRISIGKRTKLSLGTPLSLLPIAATKKGVTIQNLDDPTSKPYRIWTDMWGATLGFKWTLGKVEDRPKRSKEKVRIDRY